MTVLRASLVLVALVLGVLVTGCRWDEAGAFEEELRCGMSPGEVEALAERFAVESFRPVDEPNRYVTHVLNEGSTFFEFYFGDSGLETVRRGASTGLTTGTSYEPRANLCTGEITDSLVLRIKGSQDLAGAEIFVDGESRLPEVRKSPSPRTHERPAAPGRGLPNLGESSLGLLVSSREATDERGRWWCSYCQPPAARFVGWRSSA